MSRQYHVSRVIKVALVVLAGLSSCLILSESVAADTLSSKNRVARRASRRGTQRTRCKRLSSEKNGFYDGMKTGESCPFKRSEN